MMGLWHEYNPWKDQVVYIPLNVAAVLHDAIGEPIATSDGVQIVTADFLIAGWQQYGSIVDAYLLPEKDYISLGVRFGQNPEDYFSPPCNQQKAKRVLVLAGTSKIVT
jgi:hypothetical protein